MNPVLTVVIPVLNAADVLYACLQSLASQELARYEVIIIDGGSSDETVPIALSFLNQRGLEGKLIESAGLGIYDAMNYGAELASAEWLLFFGSDDEIHDSQVFIEMYRLLESTQANLVYGNVVLKGSKKVYGGKFDLEKLLFYKNICHQGIFYRRSLHRQLGGYNRTYEKWADWDFNIRAFSHPECQPAYVDRVITVYNELSGVSKSTDIALTRNLPKTYSHKAAAYAVCCEILKATLDRKSGVRVGLYGAGTVAHQITDAIESLNIDGLYLKFFDEKVEEFRLTSGKINKVSVFTKETIADVDILVICSVDSADEILVIVRTMGFFKLIINFNKILTGLKIL